ncbi:hypothetical protein [Alkalicoccus halolimnae]|uniref:Uncharacterized protein n=1 Tax=Alkalicoccus halolimnae TaxID=1667239 RepID=A0A5C7FD62_9BACI|nr:hypothetical protein [Alkalicoccus halolimnae]TXF82736.1 hypothetical protein FTX54_13985 [Alkalicoccus halolimnae]
MKRSTAAELFMELLKWAGWLIGIVLTIRILQHLLYFFFSVSEMEMTGFAEFAHQFTKIFMLVTGLLIVYRFLEYFVSNGLTRRVFLTSSIQASAAAAVLFAVITFLLLGIENFLLPEAAKEGNFLSAYPFNEETNLITSFMIYILSSWVYFALGMFISSGYYRYGWLYGLGFTAAGIVILILESFLWETETFLLGFTFPPQALPFLFSFLASMLLVMSLFFFAFVVLKDVRIKME